MFRNTASLSFASIIIGLMTVATSWGQSDPSQTSSPYFGIQVVDRDTGRGVPMITLTTVNGISHVTDSAGWVAFDEPGLMDSDVYFFVSGHGYSIPHDDFGYSGQRLHTARNTNACVRVTRDNLAERLYRITGQGIYRDSLLLDQPVPLNQPAINGGVLGQDTVQAAIYGGQIWWFWGDTNRASYPLGQFKTAGAVSRLPTQGGLSPETGIDLDYFVDENGFSRPMAPVEGPGVVWLHGLFVLDVDDGQEMYAHFSRRKSLAEQIEHGLVHFDDRQHAFRPVIRFPESAKLFPRGQALQPGDGFVYFATPWPMVRVAADAQAIRDPTRYQAWTCLKPGSEYRPDGSVIDRDHQGNVVWDWKADTGVLTPRQQAELVSLELLAPGEARLWITSDPIGNQVPDGSPELHSGSVRWNPYRKRWVMIGLQAGGEHSYLGDVWFAESDHLNGPWINARRIAVHHHYSFYNPAHHDFFDQREGRDIYFQGTLATTFSRARQPLPRYDYNQIMYRLSLDSERMQLPPRE